MTVQPLRRATVQYRLAGYPFRLDVHGSAWRRTDELFRDLRVTGPDDGLTPGEPADFYRIAPQDFAGVRGFSLELNGRPLAQGIPEVSLAAHLEKAVTDRMIEHAAAFLVLHAGAVSRKDEAWLFPAYHGGGKTTVVAALGCLGFTVMSDEFAPLRTADHRVLSALRALSLKEGTLELLPGVASRVDRSLYTMKFDAGRVWYQSASSLGFGVETRALRVGKIFFLERRPGVMESAVEPFPRSSALLEMTQRCFTPVASRARGFQALLDAVRGAGCYKIRALDLAEMLDAVRRAESEPSPP